MTDLPKPQSERDQVRWGFIGAGKMASALIRGLLRAGLASPQSIRASDPHGQSRESIAREAGIHVTGDNAEVARLSEVLVIAVKPQSMRAALDSIRPCMKATHLVISVAAGTTLAAIADRLGPDCRLVRVMPNTPALVGEGAAAYSLGPNADEADEGLVKTFLTAVGSCHRVPEDLMDAVTGLSGSGPAFVYLAIEALSDGGVRAGLPRDIALALAAQTVLGAARMVVETGLHPGLLKDQVTSPGGTTIAGIHALERASARAAFMDAVVAATARSRELGKGG
ncbi:MAG: pyrroline-5-carboxylate reductase [Isosphaeraceae bacterium]